MSPSRGPDAEEAQAGAAGRFASHDASVARPQASGRRTWIRRLLLISLGLLLSLAMLEIAARLLHLGSGGFWEPHSLYGWRNIPGARGWESCYGECAVFVEINSLGLRDREIGYQKGPQTTRILFLGDSMTAGMQVPLQDTFVKVLESGLNESGSREWEAINGAVNAFGTDNELIFYRLEGQKYQPDVVVLAMYLANDIYNNHRELELRLSGTGHKPYFTLDEDGQLSLHNFPVENAETRITRLASFLNRHFQLPRFAAQTLRLRADIPDALRPLVELAAGRRAAEPTQASADQEAGPGGGRRVTICAAEYGPQIEAAWAVTRALIRQLRSEVRANGAELAVLAIPASPQIAPPNPGQDWYCERPNIELGQFLEAEGIPYLDLLYPFREHALAGGESLYYQKDFHLNQAGHHLAGELLLTFIQETFSGDR